MEIGIDHRPYYYQEYNSNHELKFGMHDNYVAIVKYWK